MKRVDVIAGDVIIEAKHGRHYDSRLLVYWANPNWLKNVESNQEESKGI